jgi:hypothetical protein
MHFWIECLIGLTLQLKYSLIEVWNFVKLTPWNSKSSSTKNINRSLHDFSQPFKGRLVN